MVGRGEGSYSPSYSQVVADISKGADSHHFKKPTKVATKITNNENQKPFDLKNKKLTMRNLVRRRGQRVAVRNFLP